MKQDKRIVNYLSINESYFVCMLTTKVEKMRAIE